MDIDESYFNVSVGNDRQSRKTVSTNHNISEEKGKPKWYGSEVLPLTSLTPYRYSVTCISPSLSFSCRSRSLLPSPISPCDLPASEVSRGGLHVGRVRV